MTYANIGADFSFGARLPIIIEIIIIIIIIMIIIPLTYLYRLHLKQVEHGVTNLLSSLKTLVGKSMQ